VTDPSAENRRRAPLVHPGHPESHLPIVETPDAPSGRASRLAIGLMLVLGIAGALLAHVFEATAANAGVAPVVSATWILPFALLLGSIAAMPFIARHFWERNYPWVSIGLAGVVAAYYLLAVPDGYRWLSKSMGEYISFICLLGSLFIVSGGILIRVRRRATPGVNVGLLLAGAILANVVGTTGASMLLIRPFLRINKGHIRPFHVVFFIFVVSNLGGALTPIGDPPLFLGYLKGVPFWWVLEHCWPMWCVANGSLLAVFFVADTLAQRKQQRADPDAADAGPAVSVFGAANGVFLAMILAGVFMPSPYREGMMVLSACGSLWSTQRRIHVENVFNFAPIREVALLFVGIFGTMVPALNFLERHAGDGAMKEFLSSPGAYYFACGGLSSVLDNAPTYMTFYQVHGGGLDLQLVAMSLGSVFFGAMTYIGNGPNFMVKSIADHAGVKTPSFFGYVARFALPVLLPVLILVWGLFLRNR